MRKSTSTLCLILLAFGAQAAPATHAPRNVVLVTIDGVRVQEMFGGADPAVLKFLARGAPVESIELYQRYVAPTPEAQRKKIMPFLWGTLLQHGWLAGNPARSSHVEITNRFHTSYPGYAELLTGHAQDDVVVDNKKQRQPRTTVLEFIRREAKLPKESVAVFASWGLFEQIAEHEPGTITINAGFAHYATNDPVLRALDAAQGQAVSWEDARHDYFTGQFALDYLKRQHPRLLYVSFNDTDDLAHDGRYELVLNALTHADHFLEQLWTWLQSQPQYRDNTTLIITADHGRGKLPTHWGQHDEDVEAAKNIWLAVIGPDAVHRGEVDGGATLYQNQIAATIAREFGLDYAKQNPDAGKPISLRGE